MLGEAISMLVPQVVGFRLHGELPEGRDRDRPRAHRDRDPSADGRGREVRRVLRRGPRRAPARRSGDDREHVARVRRDVRVLPGRRRDAPLPPPDGPQRRARRARRGVLQGEPALARPRRSPRRTRRSSSSTSATVEPSLAGPRRPQDRIALATREGVVPGGAPELRRRLRQRPRRGGRRVLPRERPAGAHRAGRPEPQRDRGRGGRARAVAPTRTAGIRCEIDGEIVHLEHGAVVIAAITSCTNTSNPAVMVAAGLLAKKAVERGLDRQAVGQVEPRARLEGRDRLLRARGL